MSINDATPLLPTAVPTTPRAVRMAVGIFDFIRKYSPSVQEIMIIALDILFCAAAARVAASTSSDQEEAAHIEAVVWDIEMVIGFLLVSIYGWDQTRTLCADTVTAKRTGNNVVLAMSVTRCATQVFNLGLTSASLITSFFIHPLERELKAFKVEGKVGMGGDLLGLVFLTLFWGVDAVSFLRLKRGTYGDEDLRYLLDTVRRRGGESELGEGLSADRKALLRQLAARFHAALNKDNKREARALVDAIIDDPVKVRALFKQLVDNVETDLLLQYTYLVVNGIIDTALLVYADNHPYSEEGCTAELIASGIAGLHLLVKQRMERQQRVNAKRIAAGEDPSTLQEYPLELRWWKYLRCARSGFTRGREWVLDRLACRYLGAYAAIPASPQRAALPPAAQQPS